MTTDPFTVVRVEGTDPVGTFQAIARLHSDLIHGGVLPLLGNKFLSTLYREIAQSKWGVVYQAIRNNELIGFVAGTSTISRCALDFSVAGYGRLAAILALRIWNPQVARKFVGSLAYPFRQPAEQDTGRVDLSTQRAELLSLAVAPDARGLGVGRSLVRSFEASLQAKGDRYFVTTNAQDPNSNAFYAAVGFTKVGQKRHHDLTIQIYSKEIDTK